MKKVNIALALGCTVLLGSAHRGLSVEEEDIPLRQPNPIARDYYAASNWSTLDNPDQVTDSYKLLKDAVDEAAAGRRKKFDLVTRQIFLDMADRSDNNIAQARGALMLSLLNTIQNQKLIEQNAEALRSKQGLKKQVGKES